MSCCGVRAVFRVALLEVPGGVLMRDSVRTKEPCSMVP